MLIKVDEDLPRAVAELLRDQGHQASSVLEQEMGGWKDEALWLAVQEKEQLLVTGDKGFADIRLHPPGRHYGVVLLRPDEDGIRPLLDLIRQLIAEHPIESFARTVTVVTPAGVRIRRPT